jgi:FMN-dependent oxidoreductase (nitrilotriacetate monooxygenase family)
MCEEYVEVMYKLWQSSWRDDAVKLDKQQRIFTDPDLVREINHKGKFFDVPGPHLCQPSPQRTPVILQAGTSKSGKAFAAKHAEIVFLSGHTPGAVAASVKDIRQQAHTFGRHPHSVKFLVKICPILGKTQAEAEAKYQDLLSYGSFDGAMALFGGWTGVDMAPYGDDEELRQVETNSIRSYMENLAKYAPKKGKWTKHTLAEHIYVGGLGATVVGTPELVADEFERWMREADIDGFNIVRTARP